jgi:hypothetical protein
MIYTHGLKEVEASTVLPSTIRRSVIDGDKPPSRSALAGN